MKNAIVSFLFLISVSVAAQTNCNIGNQSSAGYTNQSDPLYKNYLVGIRFTITTTSTLTSLNLLGRNTGSSVQMALYENQDTIPGDLIIASGTKTVTSGVVSLPVTPTLLAPGRYWIMAIYSTDGGHTYSKPATGDSLYYKVMTFGNTMPADARDFTLYKNSTFTYFLGMDCGNTTAITQATNSSVINFYPNPATDAVTIYTKPNLIGETYRITDISGTQLATGLLTDETTVVDVNGLQAGFYFMILGDRERETIKFVKQ